jgi:hypothetical protein
VIRITHLFVLEPFIHFRGKLVKQTKGRPDGVENPNSEATAMQQAVDHRRALLALNSHQIPQKGINRPFETCFVVLLCFVD